MRENRGFIRSLFLIGMATLLLGLVACKSEPTADAPHAATNGVLEYKEIRLNEQDVVKTLKANDMELMTADSADSYFQLNKVKPFIYALPGKEKILVYVFDNAKGTSKARLDFAEQTKVMDMNPPLFYNVKNVLILYQHNVGGVRPQEKTAHHFKIETAIEQLLGDEIYFKHNKTYNLAKLESFMNSFSSHKADQMKITSLTIEGDPIFTYLLTDGTKLRYAQDNSEDAYAGGDKGVSKTECTGIEQQSVEGRTVFVATGCQSGDQRYILTVPDSK